MQRYDGRRYGRQDRYHGVPRPARLCSFGAVRAFSSPSNLSTSQPAFWSTPDQPSASHHLYSGHASLTPSNPPSFTTPKQAPELQLSSTPLVANLALYQPFRPDERLRARRPKMSVASQVSFCVPPPRVSQRSASSPFGQPF